MQLFVPMLGKERDTSTECRALLASNTRLGILGIYVEMIDVRHERTELVGYDRQNISVIEELLTGWDSWKTIVEMRDRAEQKIVEQVSNTRQSAWNGS